MPLEGPLSAEFSDDDHRAACLKIPYMTQPSLANSDGKSTQKLLLLWAVFASIAAASFGSLALLLYLRSGAQVGGLLGQSAELSKTSHSLPPETYTSQGFELLFGKRQLASAIATFEACLREYPDYAEAYQGLAIAQRDAGDPAKAMHNHDRAIELDPERADFYWEKGVTCQRLNNHDAAITAFEMGLQWISRGGPGFAPGNLHAGLAQSYRVRGDPQKALAHSEQAITLNPRSDWFYRERGFTYQALGNRERAEADFTTARDLKNRAR